MYPKLLHNMACIAHGFVFKNQNSSILMLWNARVWCGSDVGVLFLWLSTPSPFSLASASKLWSRVFETPHNNFVVVFLMRRNKSTRNNDILCSISLKNPIICFNNKMSFWHPCRWWSNSHIDYVCVVAVDESEYVKRIYRNCRIHKERPRRLVVNDVCS